MTKGAPERSRSTAWQSIDGEMVLLRVRARELLGLNEVARRIWELADGTHAVDQIAAIIAAEFDVALGVAEADTARFIETLIGLDALQLQEGS
ncbi:MAG: PqqD family protein [Myxococcota bacterium]